MPTRLVIFLTLATLGYARPSHRVMIVDAAGVVLEQMPGKPGDYSGLRPLEAGETYLTIPYRGMPRLRGEYDTAVRRFRWDGSKIVHRPDATMRTEDETNKTKHQAERDTRLRAKLREMLRGEGLIP